MNKLAFFERKHNPLDSVRCVAGLRTERYAFERYVELWRLLAVELFDGDAEATNILFVLTASRVLAFVDSDKCFLPLKRREQSKEYLRAEILTEEVLLEGMKRLTNYFPFWMNFFDIVHTATVGSALIDELLELEKAGQQGYRARPSLAKAIKTVQSKSPIDSRWSLSSWKGVWREFATDLPLVWAIWEMNIDLLALSGMEAGGIELHLKLLEERPDHLERLMSVAKTAQQKMLSLVDQTSKANKQFLRYPKEIPLVELSVERSWKTFEEIDARYDAGETT